LCWVSIGNRVAELRLGVPANLKKSGVADGEFRTAGYGCLVLRTNRDL
jgi:hypothetical protein